jgi:hypothetical protein
MVESQRVDTGAVRLVWTAHGASCSLTPELWQLARSVLGTGLELILVLSQ